MQPAGQSHFRPERRSKPRVAVPFRAAVYGSDEAGGAFEAETVVDNLSTGGIYLKIKKEVREGSRLLVNVYVGGDSAGPEWDGMCLEVYGVVKRVDRAAGGAFGVAISFTNSILL